MAKNIYEKNIFRISNIAQPMYIYIYIYSCETKQAIPFDSVPDVAKTN